MNCCCCSEAQPCATLCDPMDCSTPALPVHHQLMAEREEKLKSLLKAKEEREKAGLKLNIL